MTTAGNNRLVCICFIVIGSLMLGGCASYTTPGGGADMALFTDGDPETAPAAGITATPKKDGTIEIHKRKPMAEFPVNMLTVRVQESGYNSRTNTGYGRGKYSVLTVRDIETEDDFVRINKLVGIAQVSPLSRLLLSDNLQTDEELRKAASRLQADMILIYTLDTDFCSTDSSTPLSVISLGLAPTIKVRVITTLSALVMDTRTGFIYGILEETARNEQTAAVLTTQDAFDQLRQKTERQAFELFLDEFEVLWKNISTQYWKQ